jgi:hypothetical protein
MILTSLFLHFSLVNARQVFPAWRVINPQTLQAIIMPPRPLGAAVEKECKNKRFLGACRQ